MERVSAAMRMNARRATKVPSRSLSTRSATTQAPHCAETRSGRGFSGDLLCCSACEGGQPFAAPRFAHLIPESLRRAHRGLVQRFLREPHARNLIQRLLKREGRGNFCLAPHPLRCAINQSLAGFLQKPHRILRSPLKAHFKMQMRAGGAASVSHLANLAPPQNHIANLDQALG